MPDSLFFEGIKEVDPITYEDLVAAYKDVSANQKECVLEWAARSREKDPDFKKDTQSHKWAVYTSVSSHDGIGKFTEALVDDSSPWPAYFDDEVKSCYLDSLKKVTFASKKDFEYKLILRACVIPGPES